MVGHALLRTAFLGIAALTVAVVTTPANASGAGSVPTIHDLGTLGGPTSQAVAINDGGQIAGSSAATDGSEHAFLWSQRGRGPHERGMQDLGPGEAVDVNNAGQVVINDAGHVFVWAPHTGWVDIRMPDGIAARATDLNDRGQVVGSMDVVDASYPGSHAFRWQPRHNRDWIAGNSTTSAGTQHAVLWGGGRQRD